MSTIRSVSTTWFVQKTDLAKQLPPSDQAALETHASVVKKDRGELIYFDPDLEAQNKVFIVQEGFVRVVRMNMDGKRFTISILRPGEWFGALSPVPHQPDWHPAHDDEFLEALSPVTLWSIESRMFTEVLNRNPSLCFSVIQVLNDRNRQIENRLSSLLFKDVHARVAEMFLQMNFMHGQGCPYAFGLTRDICLTHQEIAELVGATRPVITGVISQFIKVHLVHKHDGYICLQDPEKLRLVAQEGARAVMTVLPLFAAL